LLSWWSGDGPSHGFLTGKTLEGRQSENPTTAEVKGDESVAKWLCGRPHFAAMQQYQQDIDSLEAKFDVISDARSPSIPGKV